MASTCVIATRTKRHRRLRAESGRAATSGKTILVVNDDPGVAELLADCLAGDGHTVEIAANGLVALDKLGRHRYDAIASGVHMPGLDGIGLYGRIKQHRAQLCRRFVLATTGALSGDVREFVRETGTPVISTPFRFEDVRRAVRSVLHIVVC